MNIGQQPVQYGPYLRVIKTGEVCDFEGFDPATQIYDLKFSDVTIKQMHRRDLEKIPPYIALEAKKKRIQN